MKFFGKKRGSKKDIVESPGLSRNMSGGRAEKMEPMDEQINAGRMPRQVQEVYQDEPQIQERAPLSDRIFHRASRRSQQYQEPQPDEMLEEDYEEEEEMEEPTTGRKKKLGGLGGAAAKSMFTEFLINTAKRELKSEFFGNFDVWAMRLLDIVEDNVVVLKEKSVDVADIVRERIYIYEDKIRERLSLLMDKLQHQLEIIDEKFAGKFNLAPGYITQIGMGWIEQLEGFLLQQLDFLMQIIDEQIEILVGRVHDRIDMACEKGYQQAMLFKDKLAGPPVRKTTTRRGRRPAANPNVQY